MLRSRPGAGIEGGKRTATGREASLPIASCRRVSRNASAIGTGGGSAMSRIWSRRTIINRSDRVASQRANPDKGLIWNGSPNPVHAISTKVNVRRRRLLRLLERMDKLPVLGHADHLPALLRRGVEGSAQGADVAVAVVGVFARRVGKRGLRESRKAGGPTGLPGAPAMLREGGHPERFDSGVLRSAPGGCRRPCGGESRTRDLQARAAYRPPPMLLNDCSMSSWNWSIEKLAGRWAGG